MIRRLTELRPFKCQGHPESLWRWPLTSDLEKCYSLRSPLGIYIYIYVYIDQYERDLMSHRLLRWRHTGRDSVSNHQPHDYLLNRLFRRRSKKTSKLRVIGLCAGNSPGTSDAENVSIWWRHHVFRISYRNKCITRKFWEACLFQADIMVSDYRLDMNTDSMPNKFINFCGLWNIIGK